MSTTETPLPSLVVTSAIPSALVAHQVFRKHETYSILVHAFLLLGPPAIIAGYLTSASISTSTFANAFQVACATYLGTLSLSVVAYRLSPWHPLARYPGPFLWRVSMLFPALESTTGGRAKSIRALHAKYGDVIRVGPNELDIVDASAIPTVFGIPGVPHGPDYIGGMLSDQNLPMVGIMDGDEHLSRRRPWNRGLAPSALKEYEPRVRARGNQLLTRLGEQNGEVVLGKWFNYFSYDFMCDMAFGGGSELLRDGDKNNVWHMLEQAMPLATFFAQLPWLAIYVGYIPGAAVPLNMLFRHARALAQGRVDRGSTARDLFHYLQNNEDLQHKPAPPTRQLVDDGILAVVAGSDTTSSSLTSLFFLILTHPDVYARLQEEVDKYYPKGEDVFDPKAHRDMHYLQAVINEALRLFPPVAATGMRKVPHDAPPLQLGSIMVPPGTGVRMPAFTHQQDRRYFSFPTTFWPERWLAASGTIALPTALARLPPTSVRDPPLSPSALAALKEQADGPSALTHVELAFTPFSHGPMNCPGKGLAMLETRTVVCAVLQRFRVRLRPEWDPAEYDRGYLDYFSATRPALPVLLEER
ncbi:high nitrogen upregulated cytochrome P450 monooxygenase 2 [Epithele typhae]|uniref:high nitrogen upregulated cytochrome P450 monooxygenase 2 n=1 Tax=Epithele typhae TaxID=378194 RepID=UPI00200720C8|nr:high nitrogen upregulated cytochrome P450 monooxygenase 2 [Epithele typhae]KAH9938835.1 high nitrogen upregulated cytochrome P450 monooxygenase 2 [Epithele typhae]